MSNNIVSISLYTSNQRVILTPDEDGKFLIPNIDDSPGSPPLVKINASELINHPKLKYMDPVLTLDDGSKMRVFQGGDPSGLMIIPASLCDKHDNKYAEKKLNKKKTKKGKVIFSSCANDSNFKDLSMDWGIGWSDDDWN
ncbi:MAG: hypothetical protein CBB97_17910 [Candidatus Endolissoclinum sp. TMED37]|nr:MAG: hypothetical protein CBB97_17910 [Candidatus Endolissoclinum sp. TMED37]